MSVRYRPVQWNAFKLGYDALLVALVGAYVMLFQGVSRQLFTGSAALSPPILAMRAWGSCAFLLLSFILCIGPLARLDKRFLPLLYNRRHAGVLMCLVACTHAYQVLGFYYAWGRRPPLEALLTYDAQFTSGSLPFVWFGMLALLIVTIMAATSHDFWQRFLGPTFWKSLHMSVYLAYVSAVVHVAFGPLQREGQLAFRVGFVLVVLTVSLLHVLAALRSTRAEQDSALALDEAWLDVGEVRDLKEGHARAVCPKEGERIALVRKDNKLYALHGICAHQRGPLYEGRIKDGCLTCPWHGWQYRAEDGRSPPPFQEQLSSYRLRLKNGRVLLDPRALPAGTKSEPVDLAQLGGSRG
jgi:nitrite reductase/ring-hydroxylating ferredoxin subunit/DMSO/TMAO reductase YedYZ heme-binding membrane subunit